MVTETENGWFETDFLGHVQTEQKLVTNFKQLDKILGPKPTSDDLGKVLQVAELEDGSIGFALVDPADLSA